MSKVGKLFIIAGIIVALSFFLLLPFIVKVKTVCVSQYGECSPQIESGTVNAIPISLYATKNKINKFLKNQFMISTFSTQFKLPNTLVINILIKKPSFVIKNDAGQEVLVDQIGKVLGTTTNSSLPELMVTGNLKQAGENIDQYQLFALNLINGVNEMYQINTGQIQFDTLVVELPMSIKVIFPLSGDTQALLGSLRLIYSKIEDGDQSVHYSQIDLRFKNPVLKII